MASSFLASGDGGREVRVLVHQEWIDASSHDGPAQIPGLRKMRLENGFHVNRLDEMTFRVVETGETLRRIGK
jgi:hypothetical protein